MSKKRQQEQKKKERERRVAQEKLAQAAKKREQEKSSDESNKPAPVKKTFAPQSTAKTSNVQGGKKTNFTQRRSGGA